MDIDNKYGMRDMHVKLLDMLFDFNNICKENGIIYSLGFGSMLGAVRDHGIIPWDDDIDVIIDRENYAKLQEAVDKSSKFILERENRYTLWVPRFRYREKNLKFGNKLTIDVFLLDYVPNREFTAKAKMLAIFALQGMIKPHLNLKKGNLLQKIASVVTYILGFFFPLSLKFRIFNKIAVYPNYSNKCACYTAEFAYVKNRFDCRLLEETIEMDFDGRMVPVSKFYNSYLTTIYGDYMTPPKLSDRIPKHL